MKNIAHTIQILRQVFDQETRDALGAAFQTLRAGGLHTGEAAQVIGVALDALIDFDKLIPGPAGQALEQVDRAIFTAAAQLVSVFAAKKAA